MPNQIHRYDKETPMPPEVASDLVTFFERNYPVQNPDSLREIDCAARQDPEALRALLEEGRIFFVFKDIREKVRAVLEMRTAPQENGIYVQLVWIMVEAMVRGQRIASDLHTRFVEELEGVKMTSRKPVAGLLQVHRDNTDAIQIYERWGYTLGETNEDGMIFMFKD